MRRTLVVLTICLLAGCAGSPPKPPAVKGEYRPINKVEDKDSDTRKLSVPRVFDFNYEGDIVNSLNALHTAQPQLTVLPPLGKISPLLVRVNLRDTTLENVLRAIGVQGRNIADVVLNTTGSQGGSQVFIQFRELDKKRGVMPLVETN